MHNASHKPTVEVKKTKDGRRIIQMIRKCDCVKQVEDHNDNTNQEMQNLDISCDLSEFEHIAELIDAVQKLMNLTSLTAEKKSQRVVRLQAKLKLLEGKKTRTTRVKSWNTTRFLEVANNIDPATNSRGVEYLIDNLIRDL